jgi:hypothetical protein
MLNKRLMVKKPVLLVFLKYPEPGKVKTRLAAEIGASVAAELYREWIGIVLRRLQEVRPGVNVVAFADGATADRFSLWQELIDEWRPQPAGDLGDRLANGFAWAHSRGGSVIAIGTDCLDITADHITAALRELESADAVFGPTSDGGYYLVGTRRNLPGFFASIRWSSPRTLTDHLTGCERLGIKASMLPPLADIDTLADWHAYLRRQGRTP